MNGSAKGAKVTNNHLYDGFAASHRGCTTDTPNNALSGDRPS